MKYVFKQIDDWTPSETTVEFTADSLETILKQFEFFLRGSGYHFDGILDIVKPDEEFEELFDEVTDTSVMAHVASELLKWQDDKELSKERCSSCGISTDIMRDHDCFDKNCPIKNNAH